jgi:hypothetical protein
VACGGSEQTMPKSDVLGQQHENSSMLDRPRIERAITELVRIAARVGVSGGDLIQMLTSGVSMAQILEILEEKSKGASPVA